MKAATAVGAAAVYAGSAAAAYFFARSHVLAPAMPDGADSEGSHTSCAYDRLAGGYDNAIGQEEVGDMTHALVMLGIMYVCFVGTEPGILQGRLASSLHGVCCVPLHVHMHAVMRACLRGC